jgi:hypothetical protein
MRYREVGIFCYYQVKIFQLTSNREDASNYSFSCTSSINVEKPV